MLSDEIDEEKRGTKVPRTRRRKSQPALWWSRLEFREIELSGYRREKTEGRNPLAELAETGHRWHGTPRTDVGRADVLAFGKEIAAFDTAPLNR